MDKIIKAYLSPDPQATLTKLLEDSKSVPSREDVDSLLGESGPLATLPQEDLNSYLAQRDLPVSPQAWICRYVYFATAVTRVFSPSCMVAYSGPNRPIPYLWVNLCPGGGLSLVSHGRWPKPRVKIMIHECLTNKPRRDMKQWKYSLDLETGQVMPCSRGSFIHLSLRAGSVVEVVEGVKEECVIALSYQGEYRTFVQSLGRNESH